MLLAIVGRPNVGKSALFNRIVDRPVAIVEDRPGVTRDRHYAKAEWSGRDFWVVDTGGFEPEMEALDPSDKSAQAKAVIREGIRRQVRLALEQADQVLFVVDGKAGLHPLDQTVADLLRGYAKPITLAVNKGDRAEDDGNRWDFAALGLGEGISVSALHGLGVAELLDQVLAEVPVRPPEPEDGGGGDDEEARAPLRVAVVGRPNVGKSSLINALLKTDRHIVADEAGTTRDAVDSPLRSHGRDLVLVDTAGIRQKSKVTEELERYSVVRSIRAIEDCHVAVLVVDAFEGVHDHDERIAGLIHEAGRACVIVVNKWDKVPKDNLTHDKCLKDIRERLKFMDYAPVAFISATEGQRLGDVLPLVLKAGDAHATRIKTGPLNKALEDILASMPLPSFHGKVLKVYYLAQTGTRPPAFALFVNDPKLLHFSTQRRITRMMRERFDLEGTPLILMLRKRS
jgi:GTP-binding protein